VHYAVQNVQDYLAALPGDQKLLKKLSGPFMGVYKPELDESPELDSIRLDTRSNYLTGIVHEHHSLLAWLPPMSSILVASLLCPCLGKLQLKLVCVLATS
jgi:hypothetical protein